MPWRSGRCARCGRESESSRGRCRRGRVRRVRGPCPPRASRAWRALLAVVEEQVYVAGSMAERAQEQRDLPAVMHAVVRRVLQELADGSGHRPAAEVELDDAVQVGVDQALEELV